LRVAPKLSDANFWQNWPKQTWTSIKHWVQIVLCALCGLLYVGEAKGQLNKRIDQLLYQHFNQPDHSVLSMKVRILAKIYHHTNNPNLSTPVRRQREEHWILKLGTAAPYGCNDKFDSVENLFSHRCNSVNVMTLFNKSPVVIEVMGTVVTTTQLYTMLPC